MGMRDKLIFRWLLGVFIQVLAASPLFAQEGGLDVQRREGIQSVRATFDDFSHAELSMLRLPDLSEWRLSSTNNARDERAETKTGGRKVLWITLAAAEAAVGVAVWAAPKEAPIPTTPSRGLGRCTTIYRPGTLATTFGYTCTSR